MDIEQMLRSGKTLEDIIAETKKTQSKLDEEKKAKEKEKANEAKLKAAKEKLVNAYIDYAEIDANKQLTVKEKETIRENFEVIVKYLSYLYKKMPNKSPFFSFLIDDFWL